MERGGRSRPAALGRRLRSRRVGDTSEDERARERELELSSFLLDGRCVQRFVLDCLLLVLTSLNL